MVVITQLVYIHPGMERVFDEFEAVAIPLIRQAKQSIEPRDDICSVARKTRRAAGGWCDLIITRGRLPKAMPACPESRLLADPCRWPNLRLNRA
jgi:hypothetical protein